jgi:hypothetical protein
MSASAPVSRPLDDARQRRPGFDSTARLVLRWLLIAALTVGAFRRSLESLVEETRGGTLIGYVWAVFAAGLVAAIAVAYQQRRGPPIHDRQTDIIVGSMGLVLSLLLHAVLLQRYSIYFDLLRLDLVAMWMFVLSSTIVLFGTRPFIRYIWVWILLLAVFPLPYQIVVIVFLGGGKLAAGIGTIVIAAFAAWICAGHNRRGVTAAVQALVLGAAVLAAMTFAFPNAALLAYQMVPSITAIVLAGVGGRMHAGGGQRPEALSHDPHPLAARQVWSGVPLVTVVAIALSFVRLPIAATPAPISIDGATFGRPLIVPAGWHQADVQPVAQVAVRLYGGGAEMLRQQIVADIGNPQWDKLSQPRTVVIDTITTYKPFTFEVYPSLVVYAAPYARLSAPRTVDLGAGVRAQLFSATDDKLLVTWNLLQWTWRNATSAERVLLLSVDNHDDGAPFPEPGHSLPTVLNSLLVVLFRGNSAVQNLEPEFKDADMLTEVGRALVNVQLRGPEVQR